MLSVILAFSIDLSHITQQRALLMLGISIALLCAVTWALSLIMLKKAGQSIHPLVMNFGKNALGFILLVPTALVIDGPPPLQLSSDNLMRIGLSGFFGVGLADAFMLAAMRHLSATSVAILECLFAPFILILSMLFLEEALITQHLWGGVLIMASLFIVLPEAEGAAEGSQGLDQTSSLSSEQKPFRANIWLGSAMMSLGLLITAGGILLVKPSFTTVPLFWLIAYRMGIGTISSSLALYYCPKPLQQLKTLWSCEQKGIVYGSFVMSSYIALSLWVAGYKYLQAPIAAILNQTSTIFTVLFAVVLLRESLTFKKVASALLASIGVLLISMH